MSEQSLIPSHLSAASTHPPRAQLNCDGVQTTLVSVVVVSGRNINLVQKNRKSFDENQIIPPRQSMKAKRNYYFSLPCDLT